jgi:acyl transferase domain-containing protein/acyl carrier protein
MNTKNTIQKIWFDLFNRIDINDHDTFTSFSGNSKLADKLFLLLENEFGKNLHISPTVAYDYPTISKQSRYIDLLLGKTSQDPIKNKKIAIHEPIAIIGMSCRFPGGINTPEDYWQALITGKNLIEDVPPSRWNIDEYYDPDRNVPGKIVSRKGGFITDHDKFDAEFFRISTREAKFVDPNQRVALETTWHALENAGIIPDSLQESATGVFLGSMFHDYEVLLERGNLKNQNLKYLDIGTSQAAIAGRISYTLGLQGPSMTIDTACSSSLTALHEACQHLRWHECNLAIAGGVNLMLLPEVSISFSRANMLSPDGECRSFSDDANGYVRSEGCGIIILKRLNDALNDGDNILAIIRGSAVNQDGASGGITVPNRLAQQEMLETALAHAALKPEDIDYIEAHGTGTPLGDPIEIGAIEHVYSGRSNQLIIGSVKSNMGHLEAASGIAAVIKLILCFKYKTIPANLHFNKINPRIHLEAIPAIIPTTPIEWNVVNKQRFAGVNNFGFTGTNAHVILEEPPEQTSNLTKIPLPNYAFKRVRHWFADTNMLNSTDAQTTYPLLGRLLSPTAIINDTVYEEKIAIQNSGFAFLNDHKVFDAVIFPASGYVEMMIRALSLNQPQTMLPFEIHNINIELPLMLEKDSEKILQTVVGGSDQEKTIKIYSLQESLGSERNWSLHAQGESHLVVQSNQNNVDVKQLQQARQRCTTKVNSNAFYNILSKCGLHYGKEFQIVDDFCCTDNEFVATLRSSTGERFLANPVLIDGPLQALNYLSWKLREKNNSIAAGYLPTDFKSIIFYKQFPATCVVHARINKIDNMMLEASITFWDENDTLLAQVSEFKAHHTTKGVFEKLISKHDAIENMFYQLTWQHFDYKNTIYPDDGLFQNKLITFDMRDGSTIHSTKEYGELLRYIQTLVEKSITNISVQIITQNAYQVLPEDNISLDQSILNGFIKTAILEHPELHIRQVDIDSSKNIDVYYEELEHYKDKGQLIAIREGRWYKAKIASIARNALENENLVPPPYAYKMMKSADGVIESLWFEEQAPIILKQNEILIETVAIGVNFRDVLNAMNLYPGNPGPLGIECSGIVRAVGEQVTKFKIGDEVLALASGSFATYVSVNQDLVLHKPTLLSFVEAASIPIVFLTAYYALVNLAQLKENQTVLVHAGAGGVGLAAIQVAQYCKAHIIATVGSVEKKEYLHSLGIEHVFDSRSLSYAEDINQLTAGNGVDVVLNSLSGPGFIEATLSCCAPQARFIEIGKRDIWDAAQVANVRSDIHYNLLALDELAEINSKLVKKIFQSVMNLVENQILSPIRQHIFPLQDTIHVFKNLQQASLIGKAIIEQPQRNIQFDTQSSYLITGGLGGIGLEVAEFLIKHGARNIILVSRHIPTDKERESIALLEKNGGTIITYQADVADRVQIEKMIQDIHQKHPLKGIFHAAGIVEDAPLVKQTLSHFEKAHRAKVLGAWNFHEITLAQNITLDYFVLFSSIASLIGTIGQSNYSSANSFLDALVYYRRNNMLKAQTINWGPWREVGMAKQLANMYERQGYKPLKTKEALDALNYALMLNKAQVGIFHANWSKIIEQFTTTPSWLDQLAVNKDTPIFNSLSIEQRQHLLKTMIVEEVQKVLGVENISETKGFFDSGMDSLSAVELKNRLQARINQALSNTVAFDYPTIDKLYGHLAQQLGLGDITSKIIDVTPATAEPLAIIGVGCRFPGGADNPEQFWELLEQGFDSSIEVPNSRWNIENYYDAIPDSPGKMISRNSCFLNVPIDTFDAQFFGISPKEAEYLDPQQRLLLEVTWETLEAAGIAPISLKESNTGVFIGILSHDYEDLITQALDNKVDAYLATGNMASTASGRISYILGLQGPSISIDTACSSSLVALHSACQSLHLGECNMAIVGGVNLILSPMLNINFSQAHMLAADGHCKTFDKNADGYVRGEGCGIIIVKRLQDALQNNDRVLAVIKGSAINQDGASSGLTVPNGPAQEDVIKRALAQAKLTPDEIDYIEAHGTGTALGDPIEINAIYNVFKNPARKALTIGTVKTNIGHLEAAAGIAGVIKTVLALKNEIIPRHLHFSERNPQIIDFNQIPAQIPLEKIEWKKQENRIRRAGVSSFAFSGTNAHVILEEAPTQDETKLALPLAKTEFHRQRYWAAALTKKSNKKLGDEIHPLLGVRLPVSAVHKETMFEQVVSIKEVNLSYLRDHQVYHHSIFPAAGYVELMFSAQRFLSANEIVNYPVTLQDISIEYPLSLYEQKQMIVQTIVSDNYVSIYSRPNDIQTTWQLHAQAKIGEDVHNLVETMSLAHLQMQNLTKIDVASFYARLAKQGLQYGPAFQTITEISVGEDNVLACIDVASNESAYTFYPPALDGALQALAVFMLDENISSAVYLPVGFKRITLYGTIPNRFYVYLKKTANVARDTMQADITLFDISGLVLAKCEAFLAKRAVRSVFEKLLADTEAVESWCYTAQWQNYTPIETNKIVSIKSYDARINHSENISAASASNLLTFLQAQIAHPQENTHVIIITEQAYSIENEPINLQHASLNGLIKTAILEHPELAIKQLDVSPGQDIAPLLSQLERDASAESLFAYRDNHWFVERIVRSAVADKQKQLLSIPTGTYRLVKDESGVIESLSLVEEMPLILTDEYSVLVTPRAVGLNFRDVLNAMNLYPGDPGPLGNDFAGIITQVGSKVKNLKVGDEVLGTAFGSLASEALTHHQLVIKKPNTLSFAKAAAIPTVFMTAYYCLVTLGKLQAGETILIHAAAGGVGLAAIQIAQYCKASIIATAGSEEKRAYLASLGVKHILDSRSLSYQKEIARITENRGVNLVLNSLTGSGFVEASLASTAQHGRFMEIAKRDIWSPEQVNAKRSDIEYHIIALDTVMTEQPEVAQQLLQEVMTLFAQGYLHPIKETIFTLSQAISAFKYLQQAKQIGKVIITIPPLEIKLDKHASYLITGGLGGLGLEVAKYLSEKGAGRIILAARRAPDAKAQKVIAELQEKTELVCKKVDITNKDDVAQLIVFCNDKKYPLKGIFHTAGVIDDAPLDKQTPERFEKVFSPKAIGGWYLHELTQQQNIALDYFVMFSSMASLIGSAAQSNYAAANSFLDTLAIYRHQHDLPAVSINWGPWREIGMAKDLEYIHKRQGLMQFKPNEGISALDYVLHQNKAQLGVMRIDWDRLVEQYSQIPSWLEELVASKNESELLKQLSNTVGDENRKALLKKAVSLEIAKVLGLSNIDPQDERTGFFELGMDSLMALELKNRLQTLINQSLSNTVVFDYPTLQSMIKHLEVKVGISQIDTQVKTEAITEEESQIINTIEGMSKEALLERLQKLSENSQEILK